MKFTYSPKYAMNLSHYKLKSIILFGFQNVRRFWSLLDIVFSLYVYFKCIKTLPYLFLEIKVIITKKLIFREYPCVDRENGLLILSSDLIDFHFIYSKIWMLTTLLFLFQNSIFYLPVLKSLFHNYFDK